LIPGRKRRHPQRVTLLKTISLLSLSNIFMTFAWHARLKGKP